MYFRDFIRLALIVVTLYSLTAQKAEADATYSVGSMSKRRDGHTATLLSNGKVLAVGGFVTPVSLSIVNTNAALVSAEIYDPASGEWADTGLLNAARSYHTATLLPNGKVLISGGVQLGGEIPNLVLTYLRSAELYDPNSGTWLFTSSMNANRGGHTATLLSTGKVLLAGGNSDLTNTLASAELYDPVSGEWQSTGNLTTNRSSHTATLLPNGKVLLTGGDTGDGEATSSAELYDPATATWTATAPMNSPRLYHTATLLPGGKVLVTGGLGAGGDKAIVLASAELYDPTDESWTMVDDLQTARHHHKATLLPNGKVLISGGNWEPVESGSNDESALPGMELYDPATSTWTATNSLNTPRYGHTATLLPNGSVIFAGGLNGTGEFPSSIASVEIFDLGGGTWTGTADLHTVHYLHTSTLLPNGKVLVAGGYNGISFTSAIAEAQNYDPATGTWSAPCSMSVAHAAHTATLLPTGKVLVAGGNNNSTGVLAVSELYDPVTGTWTLTGPMHTARSAHTTVLLLNGKVLAMGGFGVSGSLATSEIYDPSTRTWTMSGTMTTARVHFTATLLPNGSVLAVGGGGSTSELYDPATEMWKEVGTLNFARSYHSATLLPNGKVLIVGGENANNATIASAELYSPDTGTWALTAPLPIGRALHTATLLPNGKVLIAGGGSSNQQLVNEELYEPSAGTWIATGSLQTQRGYHTATLLPDGKLLVAAGYGGPHLGEGPLSSAELYDPGLDYCGAWRPQIATIKTPIAIRARDLDDPTSSIGLGDSLVMTGTQFRGISGGSSGNSQDSSTDYPLVQLRSIESGQMMFLLTTNWSDTSFCSVPVTGFSPGYALATVFVNGIPSMGSMVKIQTPIPTTTTLTQVQTLNSGALQFSFTNSVGALLGVLTSTDATASLSQWTPLGGVTETSPGHFQFSDPQATNSTQRFYIIRAP